MREPVIQKATAAQREAIMCIFGDLLMKLNLAKSEAQEIIKAAGMLQERVKPILQKLAIADDRIGPVIMDYLFTVPADYQHDTQLDTFAEMTKGLKTTRKFHWELTSRNFAKATNKLEPGRTYRVRIFTILRSIGSEDCMTFLKKQGAFLVGAQGITLLQQNKPNEFPVGRCTFSFDERDALPVDSDGDRRVTYVSLDSGGRWGFRLGYLEDRLFRDDYLLCVTEI